MNHQINLRRVSPALSVLLLASVHTVWGQLDQNSMAIENAQDTKISSRVRSFQDLSADDKARIAQSLQQESTEHFGFPAIKNIDDLNAIDLTVLPVRQRQLLDQTVMHVVETNLPPIAVLKGAIKPTGKEIYPDLDKLVASSAT